MIAAALLLALAPVAAPPAPLTPAPLTIAQARASILGRWQGQLEYRDYRADKWFGLPVKVVISDGGDGVTQLRVADFDDGPTTGIVRITGISMLLPVTPADGQRSVSTGFRKGRVPELQTARLTLTAASDATHWTLVETTTATDDNRPATLRETTVRDGASMVTLKEVDFSDDAGVTWVARNRTTLVTIVSPGLAHRRERIGSEP